MNDDSILGGTLNQLGQTAKQTVKQIKDLPLEAAKDFGKQALAVKKQVVSEEISGETGKPQEEKDQKWHSDEERIKFLQGLYGTSDKKKPSEFDEEIKDKSPEEQKKLIELRKKLHQENYYDPTFNPPTQQEERPAEKVENEKKQEIQELEQKEAKKTPPLAVVRERNKAEMFRGASG